MGIWVEKKSKGMPLEVFLLLNTFYVPCSDYLKKKNIPLS